MFHDKTEDKTFNEKSTKADVYLSASMMHFPLINFSRGGAL